TAELPRGGRGRMHRDRECARGKRESFGAGLFAESGTGVFPASFRERGAKPASLCSPSQAEPGEPGPRMAGSASCPERSRVRRVKRAPFLRSHLCFFSFSIFSIFSISPISPISLLPLVCAASLVTGCSGARPKPHGPPPEYEEPEVA